MADVTIRVTGEDAGATETLHNTAAATREAGEAAEKSSGFVEEMGKQYLKAVSTFELAKEGLKQLAEQMKEGLNAAIEHDKAIQQLSGAVTQMGFNSAALLPALHEQTEAFKGQSVATDAQLTKMQALMLRYGVAPKDIESTTKAVLDYSGATGTDAVQATELLIRGVDNGGRGLKQLGVHLNATGDRTTDLHAAVKQLEERFGGGMQAATQGLAGQMALLSRDQEELTKSMAEFAVKTGVGQKVIESLTNATKFLTYALGDEGKEDRERQVRAENMAILMQERLRLQIAIKDAMQSGESHDMDDSRLAQTNADIAKLREEMDKAGAATVKNAMAQHAAIEAGQSREQQAMKTAVQLKNEAEAQTKLNEAIVEGFKLDKDDENANKFFKSQAEQNKKDQEEKTKAEQEWARADEADEKKAQEMIAKAVEEGQTKVDELQAAHHQKRAAAWKSYVDNVLQIQYAGDAEQTKEELKREKDISGITDATAEKAEQSESKFESAGVKLGSALFNGISAGIKKDAKGNTTFDAKALLKTVLTAAVDAAMIGLNAEAFIPVVNAGLGAIESAAGFNKGGWVGGVQHFADGGTVDTVPAMLTPGERVLSNPEIGRMGGNAAVDAMASGGGGGSSTTVMIGAIDAQSFSSFMGGRGGGAMTRTLKKGDGEFSQVLRRAGVYS